MSLIYGLSYPKGYCTILQVILPLRNVLYHKDIPMITQSLGSTGYLNLFYSPIAQFITFPRSSLLGQR